MTTDRSTADEVYTAFFGEVPPDAVETRGVRLRVLHDGGLTLAHPAATGDKIIAVQQVPVTVPDADLLRRMDRVAVIRKVSADYGCRVIHYEEIAEGAILS